MRFFGAPGEKIIQEGIIMNIFRILVFFSLFAAVLAAGCSKKEPDIEISGKGESTTVQMKKEGAEVTVGAGSEIPDDFPGDIPIYPGLEVYASAREKEKEMFSVQGKTGDSVDTVSQFYRARLESGGWGEEAVMKNPQMTVLNYTKEERAVNVMITGGSDGTHIGITTGNR